jgi:4-hydroxybenzoate polyprenyltransferase
MQVFRMDANGRFFGRTQVNATCIQGLTVQAVFALHFLPLFVLFVFVEFLLPGRQRSFRIVEQGLCAGKELFSLEYRSQSGSETIKSLNQVGISHPLHTIVGLKRRTLASIAPVRLSAWWEYKTPVFLGVACWTGLVCGLSWHELLPALFKVVLALIPVASFVCVINDIADEEEDREAGKSNTMMGRSRLFKASWLGLCLAGGSLGVWMLKDSRIAVGLYLANWIVFVLYSIPPIRLKARGFLGVLADASGGQMLPTLWTAFAVSAQGPSGLSTESVVALSAWSFSLGLRGILAHQAADLSNDRKSSTETLAVRLGSAGIDRWVRYLVFPAEVLCLAWLLVQPASRIPWMAALAFLLIQWGWAKRQGIPMSLVVPESRGWFVLWRYYFTLFPVAFVLVMAGQSIWALLLLPLHLLLFPGSWGISLKMPD